MSKLEDLRTKVLALKRFQDNSYMADVSSEILKNRTTLPVVINEILDNCHADLLQYAFVKTEKLLQMHMPIEHARARGDGDDYPSHDDLTGSSSAGESYYALCEILIAIRDAAQEASLRGNITLLPTRQKTKAKGN
jgi:hypothetical protein